MIFRTLSFMLCTAILSSPANAAKPEPTGSPSAIGYQPVGKDEQGLWSQMDEVERQAKGSRQRVTDPAVTAYVRSVLCRVVSSERCGAIRLYVVRDANFNAAMAPNGMMIVNTGLLLRMRDEAELAAVLGHEFAHFENRHSLYNHKHLRNSAGWASWLTVLAAGSGGYRAGIGFFSLFYSAHFSFSREQERNADIEGVKLMRVSGYRQSAAADIWAQLIKERDARALELGLNSSNLAYRGRFASHPADIERVAYLRAAIDPLGPSTDISSREVYTRAIAPIWQMMIDDQIKLNDFGGTEFLLKEIANLEWPPALLVARGDLYRLRGNAGDYERAISFYREAIALPESPDLAYRGLGLALAKTGQIPDAQAALSEFLKRRPDAPDKSMLSMIGVN